MRAIFFAVVVLGNACAAHAADIILVTPNNIKAGNSHACNIRLEGAIVPGDAKKLLAARKRLEDLNENNWTSLAELWTLKRPLLCLNSSGGDYDEALRMSSALLADEFPETQMRTYVDSGSSCFSACAFVFLAGKEIGRGDERWPSRHLHVGAHLGFHAPYLVPRTGDKLYSRTDVQDIFRSGVDSIRRAVKIFDYRTSGGEGVETGGDPWVRSSLFVEALARGPTELLLIDTIGKVGRWNIKLIGARVSKPLNKEQLRTACDNAAAWEKDMFEREPELRFSPERHVDKPPNGEIFVASALRYAIYCVVTQDPDARVAIKLSRGFLENPIIPPITLGLEPWASYPAATPLAQLK
jgi:hypothetical protein